MGMIEHVGVLNMIAQWTEQVDDSNGLIGW